jgi:hypothetical protein
LIALEDSMMAVSRTTGALCVLSLVAGLAGCAAKFSPSVFNPATKIDFPEDATFELLPDGKGCKKDNGPYIIYGKGGGTVVWKVTNNCKKTATVYIEEFKLKHKIFGSRYPFKQQIQGKPIEAGQTAEFSAVVLDTYGSEDDRGLNVYKYRVRIVAGGETNKKDPEILIDWP